MRDRSRQVSDKLVKMFPQYTRKQLYYMLFPFWTTVSDRFKKKRFGVSAGSITVPGLGRFEFKSTAAMRKTAAKFRKRYNRKMNKFVRKKKMEKNKLIY